MRRINVGEFSKSLRKLLRENGYFQKNLAEELGLHEKVLSRKLSDKGDAQLNEQEVWRIIKILAQWKVITTRDEALHLLEQAQVEPERFSSQDWQALALSQPVSKDSRHHSATQSAQAQLPRHNLPAPLTQLVGREEAVKQLKQLLEQDKVRLVTLVGPGGSGKTRLAVHVAHELVHAFTHGVWFVALAAVRDASLVPLRIMQVLDIKPSPGVLTMQSLIAHVQDKKLLLLLDNFEHVGVAATVVSELLEAAPGLKALTTSRGVLHLYGENEFNVPPLDVPTVSALADIARLAQYSAVQLFVERAQAADRHFALTAENAASVAQICARVDGLPLALELAAARVKVLPPALLLARLSEARLAILVGGPRNLPDRQQALSSTITWSYNLLSPGEQTWFARLGVFSGGWSLEAAEAMMQAVAAQRGRDERELPLSAPALDVLKYLVDNSLVVRLAVPGEQVRFTLLETLREYALERLNERGEMERLRDWHAYYYLTVVEAAELGLRGAEQRTWQARLVTEQDNIRAALEWLIPRARAGLMIGIPTDLVRGLNRGTVEGASNGTEAAEGACAAGLPALEVSLRMAAALRPYWEWQGQLVEGRDWLDAALALPLEEEAGRTMLAARAKALSEASRLVCLQNEQSKAAALAEESIALWRQLGDPEGLAAALLYRGWSAHAMGEYALAKSVYGEGLQLLSSTDNIWLRAQVLFYMADVVGFTFEFEQMRSYYAQSRELFEQVGDRIALADVLKDEGGIAIMEGNFPKAIANLVRSIELSHEIGYKQYVATGTGLLAFAIGLRGEPDPVAASLQAAQLWGIKESLMSSVGSSSWLDSFSLAIEMKRQIRARVDEASWQEAWRSGQGLTEEQAVAICRALL